MIELCSTLIQLLPTAIRGLSGTYSMTNYFLLVYNVPACMEPTLSFDATEWMRSRHRKLRCQAGTTEQAPFCITAESTEDANSRMNLEPLEPIRILALTLRSAHASGHQHGSDRTLRRWAQLCRLFSAVLNRGAKVRLAFKHREGSHDSPAHTALLGFQPCCRTSCRQ